MRRAILLAFAAYVALVPAKARSQWAVIDTAQLMANEIHQLQTLGEWASHAAQFARQISGDVQRYQQMVLAYQAITRITDLGSAVSALGLLGIQNPLPINPYAAQALLTGRGGATGMIGSLSSLYNGTLTSNRVYETRGETWYDRQVNEQAGGIAGAQGMALQLYQSAAERVPLLNQLQARLNTAADPSEREALIARIGIENAYLQNQQIQAISVDSYSSNQERLRRQQREESSQRSIDEVLEDARARGYFGG